MARVFELLHRSGAKLEIPVKSAELLVGNELLENGEPNPNAGNLVGFNLDTEGENVSLFWARVENIDAIVVRETE